MAKKMKFSMAAPKGTSKKMRMDAGLLPKWSKLARKSPPPKKRTTRRFFGEP